VESGGKKQSALAGQFSIGKAFEPVELQAVSQAGHYSIPSQGRHVRSCGIEFDGLYLSL
jgi:hypothetical protein